MIRLHTLNAFSLLIGLYWLVFLSISPPDRRGRSIILFSFGMRWRDISVFVRLLRPCIASLIRIFFVGNSWKGEWDETKTSHNLAAWWATRSCNCLSFSMFNVVWSFDVLVYGLERYWTTIPISNGNRQDEIHLNPMQIYDNRFHAAQAPIHTNSISASVRPSTQYQTMTAGTRILFNFSSFWYGTMYKIHNLNVKSEIYSFFVEFFCCNRDCFQRFLFCIFEKTDKSIAIIAEHTEEWRFQLHGNDVPRPIRSDHLIEINRQLRIVSAINECTPIVSIRRINWFTPQTSRRSWWRSDWRRRRTSTTQYWKWK